MRMNKLFKQIFISSLSLLNIAYAQQKSIKETPLLKKELSIASIAANTAKGNMGQLHLALNKGLNNGLTIHETKEIIVQLYAYAGFPRSLNALNQFMSVLEERNKKGIKDKIGVEASINDKQETKLAIGTTNQTKLVGKPVSGKVYEFAPAIDQFLKEHLFGDIFGRDNLTWKNREIATIAALASLGGAETQLKSHINVGIYNGLTISQLKEMVIELKSSIGVTESNNLEEALISLNYNKNPFTLVYEGAISENKKGEVNIHAVYYKINNISIAANIYTPANYNPTLRYATVVIAHPNGGVKEQVAGLYAQKLAEQGFITITADAAFQGASGGYPRNTDKPANRIEDIYTMADYISQFPGADTAKLNLLGICGGGGYALKAGQADKRFKRIATISMFNSGEVRRNGFLKSQINTIQERLKIAADARAMEAAGGEVLYTATTTPTDDEIAKIPTDLYREGYQYYHRTHVHPNSTFKYTTSSLMDLMTFDASSNMDLINQPLLMIVGSKADTKYMTDDAFNKASNAKYKELYLLDGATHIQTYWKQEYVNNAINKLANFYTLRF